MKKIVVIILCAAFLLALAACGGKNVKNVKDKTETFTMSREELTEALEGVKEADLVAWWGEPSSFFSGLYGSIWTMDDRYIAVYFDRAAKTVENVICGELDENGFMKTD